MKNRWSDTEAKVFVKRYGTRFGRDLALRTYASRLLGAEPALVLHGGGNTSVKTTVRDVLGRTIPAIFVKASGTDLRWIDPREHTGLDLNHLLRFKPLGDLPDSVMINEFRTHLLDSSAATPSLETLLHAFIPHPYVDHTHPEAFLALTNLRGGERKIRSHFGDDVAVVPYVAPGFALARAVLDTYERRPGVRAVLILHHGLVTWGATAREAYESTIRIVSKAERLIRELSVKSRATGRSAVSREKAERRYVQVAPKLRGILSNPSGDPDRPFENVVLRSLITREVLTFMERKGARALSLSPPLTTDYLIRTKAYPLWVDLRDGPEELIEEQLLRATEDYAAEYGRYLLRNAGKLEEGLQAFDPNPRVIFLPGIGVVCAGRDSRAAEIERDITQQAIRVKTRVAAMGHYGGLSEKDLFHMEYRGYQHAKLGVAEVPYLSRRVALVTGAAGAIGSGICRRLLEEGCHVAGTDLPGKSLETLYADLSTLFPGRFISVPLDVSKPESVRAGMDDVILAWGGVDLVVINAGLAHVANLTELTPDAFHRLDRVNTEGTLNLLRAAGQLFSLQKTGGDVVLISTKNVFAPGASFGAYSATKAAAHQLSRSLSPNSRLHPEPTPRRIHAIGRV